MVSNDKWHRRFLELAAHIATWSKDPSTKVGCVIVDKNKRIVSLGYNGFPRGVFDTPGRYDDRNTKLLYVSHAERNALDNSRANMEGCILYSTLFPCNDCAKSIIQTGITAVYSYKPALDPNNRFNWDITKSMFDEANVQYFFI